MHVNPSPGEQRRGGAGDVAYEPARRHRDEPTADADIRSRVQQLTVRQQRFERSVAKGLDVDAAGLEVLDRLISDGPSTPTALAHGLEISTAAMTLVLNRLEARGRIRRDRHPSDGRKLIVTASEDAADAARRMLTPLIEEVEHVIAALRDDERESISRFLDELIRAYDRTTPATAETSGTSPGS